MFALIFTEKVAADDHRLALGVVDVRRNDRAPARDLVAHELRRDALAQRDELHLGRDLAAPRVVHLRDVRARLRAPRPARARESAARRARASLRGRAGRATSACRARSVSLRASIQRSRSARQAAPDVDRVLRIGVRTARYRRRVWTVPSLSAISRARHANRRVRALHVGFHLVLPSPALPGSGALRSASVGSPSQPAQSRAPAAKDDYTRGIARLRRCEECASPDAPNGAPSRNAATALRSLRAARRRATRRRCGRDLRALRADGRRRRSPFRRRGSRLRQRYCSRSRPSAATARRPLPRQAQRLALAGVALAVHFAGWIASLQYTTVAVSTLLVATAPIWTALYDASFARGPPSPRALWAFAGGAAGLALVVGLQRDARRPIPGRRLARRRARARRQPRNGGLSAARARRSRLARHRARSSRAPTRGRRSCSSLPRR